MFKKEEKLPVVLDEKKLGPPGLLDQTDRFEAVVSKSIAAIKSEIADFSAEELRALKFFEESRKSRKTLLNLIDKLLENRLKSKLESLKSADGEVLNSKEGLGGGKLLDNISFIVESDMEDVHIKF